MQFTESAEGDDTVLQREVYAKVASYGFFVDHEWDTVFLVIRGGLLRLYASESDYRSDATAHVYELALDVSLELSPIYYKDYSNHIDKTILLSSFYVYKTYGGFMQMKILKIGSASEEGLLHVREMICRARLFDVHQSRLRSDSAAESTTPFI